MARNIQETKSMLAVSRAAQTDLHTAAVLGCRFQVDSGGLFKTVYDREDNAEEINGYEGASEIVHFGRTAEGELSQKRAKPDFILWALAFALGQCSSSAAGASGYAHTITPMTGSTMKAFTAAQILGETLLRERYVGNVISEFTLGLTEKWITAKASVKGCGKKDVDWIAETVTDGEDSTQLTVTQNIQGATEAARLDSIHLVRVKKVGETHWTHVTVTGSSAATKIEITAPGTATDNVDFEVLYVPTVQSYFTGLPAIAEESYLKIMDLTVRIGGAWDGTAVSGGRLLTADFLSGELKVAPEVEMRFVPGSGIEYAGDAERTARVITLSLTQRMRDVLMEHWLERNEYFAASIKISGAEFETGHRFEVEVILPKLGINTKQITINNKVFAAEGDLVALEGTYPAIIVKGKNQVASYL